MSKATGLMMDVPDPTKQKNAKYLINVKVVNTSQTPARKLECHGTYDKSTVDAILKLMGIE
jgi:hypothetical protein